MCEGDAFEEAHCSIQNHDVYSDHDISRATPTGFPSRPQLELLGISTARAQTCRVYRPHRDHRPGSTDHIMTTDLAQQTTS